MNCVRPRTAATITAAVLSLSITPMAVQGSAWASSGGSASMSSSQGKRASSHDRAGTESGGDGASSGEDSDSTGGLQSSNSKRAKKNSSSQKVHTRNTQAFQKVVLDELKERPEGLLAQELTDTLVTSGTLGVKNKHVALRVTKAALNAVERKEAVEKVANSSPTKYRITEKGRGLTSLMRESLTTSQLRSKIVELFERHQSSFGITQEGIFQSLGYARGGSRINNAHHDDILGHMVAAGELALTREGRYILPQH